MAGPRKNKLRENAGDATAELRDKVKSKMEVAYFFAGFITLLLGILLTAGGVDSFLPKVGIVFLTASLGFCVAAVFCYDRLLMPREYWTALPEDKRSEEGFQDRLQQEMVRSWQWLFVPAVLCFGIGFLLVLANVLGLKCQASPFLKGVLLGGLLTIAVVAPICLSKLKGPKIYD